jgi:hypothetical protein
MPSSYHSAEVPPKVIHVGTEKCIAPFPGWKNNIEMSIHQKKVRRKREV